MRKILALAAIALCIGLGAEEKIEISGLYIFGNDIVGNGDPNTILVRVSANNVTIDLSGRSIRHDTLTSDTTSAGIVIDPEVTDITIQNGIIGPINGTGVIVSPGCSNIIFKDLQISNCSNYGVDCRGTTTSKIDGISYINCSIEGCGSFASPLGAAFSAAHTQSIFASNSYFSQTSTQNLAAGFYCSGCTSADFSDCKFSNNRGGTAGIGAYVTNSSDFRFENCTILRNGSINPSTNAIGCGIRIENSQNIMIVNSTIAASYSPTGSATNISSINSSSIGLLNSIIIGATGGIYASGIYAGNGIACAVINCIIQGTRATGTAHGISYSNISAGYLRGNSILNTSGTPSVGIIDTTTPSASLIAENYAFNNGTNYVVTYTDSVTLPLIIGGFSGTAGLPLHVAGMLDNVSVNYQATGTATNGSGGGSSGSGSGSSLVVTLTATTSLITSPLASIGASIGLF